MKNSMKKVEPPKSIKDFEEIVETIDTLLNSPNPRFPKSMRKGLIEKRKEVTKKIEELKS